MPSLDDYLKIDADAARSQWSTIDRRPPLAQGGRQVDYLPVETLMCFALGLVSEPNASGRINLRAGDPDVQKYARLMRRTPKSLAAKLQNLNGRRDHSATHERELWITLTSADHAFDDLYSAIIRGAREAGIDADAAPDVLGAEKGVLTLIGQAARVSDHDLLMHAREAEWIGDGDTDVITERLAIGVARVGHSQFARRVLMATDFSCAFCGLSARRHGIPSSRLLIASHVKPWRVSAPRERIDPRNGIAACPTHDAAFEQGLICVGDDGAVRLSERVAHAVQTDHAWERSFGPSTLSPHLRISAAAGWPAKQYLDWQWSRGRARQASEHPTRSQSKLPSADA